MEQATRVMLVEDEEDLVRIVESCFQDEGFEVKVALNAEDALKLLTYYIPDIIVSDVRMAMMDGFDLLELIRKRAHTKEIPFIFLTIMDDRASVERAKALGADAFMTKPFDVEDLVQKVKEVLASKNK
ncbi:MAG: response regulator [bacterium]